MKRLPSPYLGRSQEHCHLSGTFTNLWGCGGGPAESDMRVKLVCSLRNEYFCSSRRSLSDHLYFE